MKNRNAVYEARDRGRSYGKTEGAAKRRKGRRFLAKQGKIYHGGGSRILETAAGKKAGQREMRVELIDVDGHNFPSLPLMKIAAWHKRQGDSVEWYNPLTAWLNPPDKVYMSKVFTFTPDYQHPVNAKEIIRGGTGYSYPDGGAELPEEIEHIYPDYSIYFEQIPDVKETAYGFLTRGCPRGCDFCIVEQKEGRASRKVADLSEFWRGQKNIVLLDPNMFACKEWEGLSNQLINSGAWVDFSQGCDIRIIVVTHFS